MASEAAEAGLIPPMTLVTMSRGHMQSLNLLALKLWICIDSKQKYRQLCGLEKYIVRFIAMNTLFVLGVNRNNTRTIVAYVVPKKYEIFTDFANYLFSIFKPSFKKVRVLNKCRVSIQKET